jgi:hypothetical protein
MRLQQYLTEDRSKKIKTRGEVIDLIKKICKQALEKYKKDIIIFRGLMKDNYFLYVDPKAGRPRISANTRNYYTLMNDNSPYWKGYPKRSESLICTTSSSTSEVYGNTYIVLPYDNAKIGVCYEDDYWGSFPNLSELVDGYYNLNMFNRELESLFKQVDIPLYDDSYKKLQHSFGLFDLTFNHDLDSIESLIYEDGFRILKGYEKVWDLMKHFNILLAPEPNKFDLYKINNFRRYTNREVWTDSKSILINIENDFILRKL